MTERMSAASYRAATEAGARRSKYGAKAAFRCEPCGATVQPKAAACLACGSRDTIRFDSRAEARRWDLLRSMSHGRMICELERQPRFDLVVNGVHVGRYTADFRYRDHTGAVVVEDVKSEATMTQAAALRIKLVEAIHGVKIAIVGGG